MKTVDAGANEVFYFVLTFALSPAIFCLWFSLHNIAWFLIRESFFQADGKMVLSSSSVHNHPVNSFPTSTYQISRKTYWPVWVTCLSLNHILSLGGGLFWLAKPELALRKTCKMMSLQERTVLMLEDIEGRILGRQNSSDPQHPVSPSVKSSKTW